MTIEIRVGQYTVQVIESQIMSRSILQHTDWTSTQVDARSSSVNPP